MQGVRFQDRGLCHAQTLLALIPGLAARQLCAYGQVRTRL